MKNHSILFLLFTPRYSGAEISLVNYLKYYNNDKYIIGCGNNNQLKHINVNRIKIIPSIKSLNRKKNYFPFFRLLENTIQLFCDIKRIIYAEKINILFINNYQLAFYAIPLVTYLKLIKSDTKLMWFDHNLKLTNVPFGNKLENLCSNIYDKTIILSNAFINKYKTDNKIVVLPNSIDCLKYKFNEECRKVLRAKLNINDDIIIIGIFGQITERKAIDKIINLIYGIGLTNLHFLIIGNINYLDIKKKIELEKLIAQFNETITHIAWTNEICDYYSVIDVYMNLSDMELGGEALPLVILEAMSCSRVVIANKIGAIEDVIDDGVNGFLIESTNDYYKKNKLKWIIQNLDQLDNIRINARNKILTDYNILNNMSIFERIIDEEKNR